MSRPAMRTVSVLGATVWLALAVGLLECGILAVRKFALHEFLNRSPDVWWLAPTAYLALFLPAGLGLALLARWRPGWPAVPMTVLLLGWTGLTALLLLVVRQKLHPAAVLLLGLGVAAQAARLVRTRPAGFAGLVRRTTPAMALLVLALAAGLTGGRWWRERRAVAALPPAPADAPNVLLIIWDTARAPSLSLYGYGRPTTPGLERWAARGAVFERAYAVAPWTLPSHASMFTGRWPHELSTGWLTPLDDAWPTLAEAFRDRGYRTGAFVANLQYATREHGLARGFLHYRDYRLSLGTLVRSATLGRRLVDARTLRRLVGSDELVGRTRAEDVNRELLDWVDGRAGRPFFAFLNLYDAHDPYLPPREFYRRVTGEDRRSELSPFRRHGLFQRRARVTPDDIRLERNGYDGALAYLDAQLDSLFGALDRRGVLANTVVILTSDHGEEFGERGVFYHGHTLYADALHVPLAIWYPPAVPAGVRVAQPVSLRDLAATIADLAGLPEPRFPGTSLAGAWRGDPTRSPAFSEVQRGIRIPDWYPAAHDDLRSLVEDRFHLIRGSGGSEQLFDLGADPGERRDLAGEEEVQAVRQRLGHTMNAIGPLPVTVADPRRATTP